MKNLILLITDKKYVESEIFGGVQLCTHEFIDYFTSAGCEVKQFRVSPSIGLIKRIKIKLGVDTYDRYDIEPYYEDLLKNLVSPQLKFVCFNQLDLAFWAGRIRSQVAGHVKFLALSHGNESGDYLHTITKMKRPTPLQVWKLGRLLTMESRLFESAINGVIVLSENEEAIDQWIGAKKVLYLPRLLKTKFLNWEPRPFVAGFVGTLDHLPNLLGIQYLAEELSRIDFKGQIELIGGPEATGRALAQKFKFIKYAGAVSDHMLPDYVRRWSVFLNPVFWYSRGASTKLAQAISWGVPCLTTPAGRRGYDLKDTGIVTRDNTPACFAGTLAGCLIENEQLLALKESTERNANNFDQKQYIEQLTGFLQNL